MLNKYNNRMARTKYMDRTKYSRSGGAEVDMKFVNDVINNYPTKYPTPKYIQFIQKALLEGFRVDLYMPEHGASKYVNVYKGKKIFRNHFKVRFSNHLPIPELEAKSSCDFFVGKTNFQITNTEMAWNAMMYHFHKNIPW